MLQRELFDNNVVVNGGDAIGIFGDHAGKVFLVSVDMCFAASLVFTDYQKCAAERIAPKSVP